MADELLDQVDKNDNVIGTVWRSDAHGNPNLMHREVGVCVFNHNSEVLLAQRAFSKKNDPGAWMMAAAGHPISGEEPLDAIKKEIKEELGLSINPIFYGKNLLTHKHGKKKTERRWFWLYYVILDNYPELRLQESEVNDIAWVKVRDLEKFASKNKYNLRGYTHKKIIEIAKFLKII